MEHENEVEKNNILGSDIDRDVVINQKASERNSVPYFAQLFGSQGADLKISHLWTSHVRMTDWIVTSSAKINNELSVCEWFRGDMAQWHTQTHWRSSNTFIR